MLNCKNCIFYDKMYDDLRRSGQDMEIIGEDNQDLHFCRLYPDGIPPKVWDEMKKCPSMGEMK